VQQIASLRDSERTDKSYYYTVDSMQATGKSDGVNRSVQHFNQLLNLDSATSGSAGPITMTTEPIATEAKGPVP
jgi:hypothetical protein